jgi:hypothetical protein
VGEITLRPIPIIEVLAHPAAALDVRAKRLLKKELRPPWEKAGSVAEQCRAIRANR